MKWKQVTWLLKKDLIQEWRQSFTIQGILLYVMAAVFVVYLSVLQLNPAMWNAFFWIIMLFSGVSAVSKSFLQETPGKLLYYHQLMHPASMMVAKLIYNTLFMVVLAVICWFIYGILLGQLANSPWWFLLAIGLGASAFSAVLTMASAIASKTGNPNLIMPVLSLPLLIPFLLVAVKATKKAVDGLDPALIYPDLGGILLFHFMAFALGLVLYPFLWKE